MNGAAVPPGGDGAGPIAGYIAAWRPSQVPPPAASFARAVAARAGPGTRARANALLWAAARLAAFGVPLGLEPVPEVLLHPPVIERFAVSAPGLSGPARRTLRTNLRFIARRVAPALAPADASLPRERAKAPYSPAEIAGFLALADAQPTASRRMRAAGLVCLGAGAGLTGADLRGVRGTHVACRSGGVIADVSGARPRAVPALARYHQRLLACAAFASSTVPGAYSLLAVPVHPADPGPVLTARLMLLTIAAAHSQRSGHRATRAGTFAPTTRGPLAGSLPGACAVRARVTRTSDRIAARRAGAFGPIWPPSTVFTL